MVKFYDAEGQLQSVELTPAIHKEAHAENLSVKQFLNRRYGANAQYGTAYDQFVASLGLIVPKQNSFGLRAPTIADILDGKAAFNIDAAVNVKGDGTPYGNESRNLFPVVVVDMIEQYLKRDYTTDGQYFDQMVALDLTVNGDVWEQPQINFTGHNGPQQARAQRIGQLAEPAAMVRFTTSDKVRKIGARSIGAEFSQQALRATTLDLVGLSLSRFMEVEMDAMVYEFIGNMLNGDGDLNIGALSSVNISSFDTAATGGKVTHKGWVKWLHAQRRLKRIDWIVCDIDTYLKIESREGRPGLTNVDQTLAKIDAQAVAQNPQFGEVKVFLVDSATEGGPIPAGTVLGLDSRYAITRVKNIAADYQASETFALKRSEALRIDWGVECYRQWDEAFSVLNLA